MTRIAHLSDPHLDGGPGRARRLERVLAEVAALPDVDLVAVTGDVAEHGDAAEYAQFFDLFAPSLPAVVVPGNHDLRAPMSERVPLAASGRLDAAVAAAGLTLVGLDSLVEGEMAGALTAATLDFARAAVAAAPGPVVLALHHPPVPVGHAFVDRHGLRDVAALADLVASHDAVVAVLAGHVHAPVAAAFAGRPLLCAPGIVSTMRLGGRLDPIADEDATPGLAFHTVHPDRRVTTVFHHLTPGRG